MNKITGFSSVYNNALTHPTSSPLPPALNAANALNQVHQRSQSPKFVLYYKYYYYRGIYLGLRE